jgi:hypothetical protein
VEKEDIWLKSVGQRIRRMNNQLQRAKLEQWQWTKRSLVLMNNYSVKLKVRLIILILIADTGATVHMTPYKDKLIDDKTQSTSNGSRNGCQKSRNQGLCLFKILWRDLIT